MKNNMYVVNVYLNENAVSMEDILNRRVFLTIEEANKYVASLPSCYKTFVIEVPQYR